MTKSELKESLHIIIYAAKMAECEDLHHKPNQYHKEDEGCPVENEVREHCKKVQDWINNGLKGHLK